MRFAALAFFVAAAPTGAQEPTVEKIVSEMQARAPRFKDADLRYLARLNSVEEIEISGETRLTVVPGAGFRSDGSILAVRSRERGFQELEIDVASAEVGDDLYFWGAAHRGPAEMFMYLPPCLSLKGKRGDYPASLDVFPTDFPFRWVYDDPLALYSLAPREAFARDPGLKAVGKQILEGKPYHVLEVSLPTDKLAADTILRLLPIGTPGKRFFIEPDTWRLARIELSFEVDNRTFFGRWDVKSRRDFAGGSVPEVVELSMTNEKSGRVLDDMVRLTKRLMSAAADRGLGATDLVPEDRRQDLHADAPLQSQAYYSALLEKDPKAAAAYPARTLARYREALAAAIKGPDPKMDPLQAVADFEKAQRLAPASPFVNLSLLKLYDVTNQPGQKAALAEALEGQPIRSSDLRLALASYWATAGNADRAMKHLEAVDVPRTAPLRMRLGRVRALIAAHVLRGQAAEGGKALAALFETAAAEERMLLLDALAPIPLRRRGGGVEENKALQAALDAALAAKSGDPDLQDLRLRAAFLGDDERFAKALDAYADSVAEAGALSRAALLALQRNNPEPGMAAPNWGAIRPAAEKVASKAPASAPAALLAGLALHGAGEKDAALKRLEDALAGLEKEAPSAASASSEFLTPLARAFGDAGRDDALIRTCRLFVATVNRTPRPWRLLRGAQDPLGMGLGMLVGKGRYIEAFQVVKELDRQKITYLHSLRPALRSSEQAFVKAAKEHVLKTSKDPADFRKLATLVQLLLGRSEDAVELLEKANQLAPGDVELMYEYASVCLGSRDSERAVKALEEVLAALEKAPSDKVDRNLALFQLAQLHGRSARHDKVVAALDKADLNAPNLVYNLANVGILYEQAGAVEKAIAAYRKSLEKVTNAYSAATSGVFGRLGRLHEKREDYQEAYRVYTRGIRAFEEAKKRYGESSIVRPRFGPDGKPVPDDSDPAALRAALLKRIGEDYFIQQLLKKPVEPLGAEGEKRVKALFETLRSDSIIDRDDAALELRRIGPKAAPFLKAGLESGDAEFRARVRQILAEWAEPK